MERGRWKEGKRERGKEGKRERGKEGKRERGKEGKRERGKEGKREKGKENVYFLNLRLPPPPPCFRFRCWFAIARIIDFLRFSFFISLFSIPSFVCSEYFVSREKRRRGREKDKGGERI
jgi:hypothetical protein